MTVTVVVSIADNDVQAMEVAFAAVQTKQYQLMAAPSTVANAVELGKMSLEPPLWALWVALNANSWSALLDLRQYILLHCMHLEREVYIQSAAHPGDEGNISRSRLGMSNLVSPCVYLDSSICYISC